MKQCLTTFELVNIIENGGEPFTTFMNKLLKDIDKLCVDELRHNMKWYESMHLSLAKRDALQPLPENDLQVLRSARIYLLKRFYYNTHVMEEERPTVNKYHEWYKSVYELDN